MSEFRSNRAEIMRLSQRAFRQSADDVLGDAGKRSGQRHIAASGQVEMRGSWEARVVFDAPDATARERGAYITPHQAKALRFADGTFAMHARLPRHPYLKPAGDRWGAQLNRRMREVSDA